MKKIFFALLSLLSVSAMAATTVPSSLINWVAPLPVLNGGTGATTASGARTALGVPSTGANTFTGIQTTSFANAVVKVNDSSGASGASYELDSNSSAVWEIKKSSANVFNIGRYVSGVYTDNPFSIANATGVVTYTAIPVQPTPSTADNSTNSATTAYVKANLASYATLASPTFTGTVTAANLTATGTLTGFKGRLLNVQVFTTGGTYTPTTGTAAVYVKVQAGGGAGGGTQVTNSSQAAAGSGGTAGAYAEGYFTSAFSGVTMTVGPGGTGSSAANGGAGGTTSFGALLSCPGGAGGLVGSASTSAFVTGASGNTAACTGTSLLARVGQQGSQSIVLAGPASRAGDGGSSSMGVSEGTWSTATGVAGLLGGGGSGANAGISTAAQAGAAGGAGYIEVFEFSQ